MVAASFKQILKQQFGHPAGALGHVAGWIMALQNRERTIWAVEKLNANRSDRVLEIGIGPGVAIQLLAEVVLDGYIAGIDNSPVMIDHATTRNFPAIDRGRVELKLASVEKLPFEDDSFDKVFAINTLHHWENHEQGLKEIYSVLKSGGQITIVEQPRGIPDAPDMVEQVAERIKSQLTAVGFDNFAVHSQPTESTPMVCVQGIK